MNIAVVLAGGSGKRLGSALPKQFLEVAGKTILDYSISAFEQNDNIDEIAIVSKEDFIEDVKALVEKGGYKKVKKILAGGKERYDSSLAAINAYTNDDDNLLLHDAVRPLVSQRIINDCIEALQKYNAIDIGIDATDTIVRVNENGIICDMPPRASLRNVQTPQGFKRGTIRKAYEIALKDPNFVTTDDCGVVFRYLPDEPIYIVKGETTNFKVTYPEDIALMEKLVK